MRLDGKVAVVTGGSRGIGRAICLGLAAHGASVVVSSRTEVDRTEGTRFEKYSSGTINDTASLINERGGTALAICCDVTRAEDIQRMMEATLDRFGHIDVLVSNAGVDCESPVAELDVDLLDRCLAVNVRGPLLLCKFGLPAMIARGAGSIMGITSGSARNYREARVGYSMSKAALERMFLSLAEEARPHNIAVNLLNPGRIDTWMNRNGDWPGTAHIPMEQPEAVVPAAVWLAGQSAASFTGRIAERARFGITWGPGLPPPG